MSASRASEGEQGEGKGETSVGALGKSRWRGSSRECPDSLERGQSGARAREEEKSSRNSTTSASTPSHPLPQQGAQRFCLHSEESKKTTVQSKNRFESRRRGN